MDFDADRSSLKVDEVVSDFDMVRGSLNDPDKVILGLTEDVVLCVSVRSFVGDFEMLRSSERVTDCDID